MIPVWMECVPNVSEGRRSEVIDALAATLGAEQGVHLLDVHRDPDHNRSVFTIVGEPTALREGLLSFVAVALSRIDMRTHRGEHPRMGAVDVIPFVPLGETTLAACGEQARRFGQDVADRFDVPVLLYADAALLPHRRRLEDVRRGGFEALGERLSLRAHRPDYGPTAPHPTFGAVAVGARPPLIAFNVNLRTKDISIARAVARAIRESSGGLVGVKALGLDLSRAGHTQVSMNIIDHERAPLSLVFDRVSEEAARHGVDVSESEIVGLVPAAALPADPATRLRLPRFSATQILEERIRQIQEAVSAGSRFPGSRP